MLRTETEEAVRSGAIDRVQHLAMCMLALVTVVASIHHLQAHHIAAGQQVVR